MAKDREIVLLHSNDNTSSGVEEEGEFDAMVMEASFTIYEEADSTMNNGGEGNLVAGRGKLLGTTKIVLVCVEYRISATEAIFYMHSLPGSPNPGRSSATTTAIEVLDVPTTLTRWLTRSLCCNLLLGLL